MAHYNFTGPTEPVGFIDAVTHCHANRLWCFRPVSLTDSGMLVAWRVRDGVILPVGEHEWINKAEVFTGLWQVMTIAELEREVTEHDTGVEL